MPSAAVDGISFDKNQVSLKRMVFRKKLVLLAVISLNVMSYAQNITVFKDAVNRLYLFNEGVVTQIYYQATKDVQVGTKHVCIVDSKGDVYAYFGDARELIAQTSSEIINTDHLLFVRTATVLRVFDQGVVHMISPNALAWGVGDSLVLFQDVVGGYLRYYYEDEIHEISMVVGHYPIMPGDVGSNLFAYRDNAKNHLVFWHGKFHELMNTSQPVTYSAGQDVLAFNDPQHNTFAAFDNGYIIDLESQFAKTYKAGDNFIYYQDASDIHKVVREERVIELGVDLQNLNVTDSLVIYNELGVLKIWFNEKIYQVFNNVVTEYQADGGIVAYKNAVGGVSAFVRGKEIDITKTRVDNFKLTGSTILLQFGPSSYSVWWNGKIYDF
jgi:hypothetical protein